MVEPTPFGLVYSQRTTDPTGQEIVEQVATGWLASYVEYGIQLTDAPAIFHLAVGISVLSTACGNRIRFRGGGNRTHWPNLYILFIAPSGLMRKSTSIDMGTNLLRHADPDCVMPNESSREEFIRLFAASPESLIRESEFASALSRYDREYMGGMKALLTDLWDCQHEYRRQIRGKEGKGEKIIINCPALNYLAASTIEWLIDCLTENDLRSGFLARFLIFPAAAQGNWVSFFSDIDDESEQRLAHTVASIRRMGIATMDFQTVMKRFNDWSREIKSLDSLCPPEMAGFSSRLTIHTAKLAALMQLSEDGARESYTISMETFERARKLMEWLRTKYADLIEQKLVFSKEERIMQRILDPLRLEGKGEWRDALRRSHLKVQDFERYMNTLIQRGEVEIKNESTRGRPVKTIHFHNGRYSGGLAQTQVVTKVTNL